MPTIDVLDRSGLVCCQDFAGQLVQKGQFRGMKYLGRFGGASVIYWYAIDLGKYNYWSPFGEWTQSTRTICWESPH